MEMIIDINTLNSVKPISDAFNFTETQDFQSLSKWKQASYQCEFKAKLHYPKFIRKKYHSPKRRNIELINFFERSK